jgi:glutamate-ammonia-ligase adenylyltransferase
VSVFDSRSSGAGLLVRLGFEDPAATESALVEVGLWRDGRPADAGAAEVVTALADVADPDLALSTLVSLLAGVPDRDALREALCTSSGLRRRLLGVLGTSVALGDHLVAHPAQWEALAGDEVETARPSLYGLQSALLASVGATADVLPWGTGGARAALQGRPAVEALRAAYRRACSSWPPVTATGSVTVEEVGRRDGRPSPPRRCRPALAVALATLPDGRAAAGSP